MDPRTRKYQQDRVYREQEKARLREVMRRKRAKERPQERPGRWTKKRAENPVFSFERSPRVFPGHGLCYTAGKLLHAVSISAQTLNAWRAKGIVPQPLEDERGWKWYPVRVIQRLASLVERGRREGWSTAHLQREAKGASAK